MIVTLVNVWVKDNYVNDFVNATIENHTESVKEPGNLRFDILRDAENETKFVLYEAYESEEAAAGHKNTPHYLRWRNQVSDWMSQPRSGVKHYIVYPQEKSKW